MSRLLESIKLVDGRFYNLHYHEQRMAASLRALYGTTGQIGLEDYLKATEFPREGVYKCRVIYDDALRQVSFSAYQPRKIKRLKLVEDNAISYSFKFADRQDLDRVFEKRTDCDDVLIAHNGMVADCSFSNIVFRKGSEWFTPDTPLLMGTMRQRLLDENKITLREIPVMEIRSFDTFKIINAMLEFESPEIEVSDIVF